LICYEKKNTIFTEKTSWKIRIINLLATATTPAYWVGLVGWKFFRKISHRMFRTMSEGVFYTNKKTNYIACLETARRIY
jgi:hypothetical protein